MKMKRTITELVDDLDGATGAETVSFSLNGSRYEIELGEKNRAELSKALDPYIKKARKVGEPKPKARKRGPAPSKIRAWAAENGVEVSPTGRIPKDVAEQYKAAH